MTENISNLNGHPTRREGEQLAFVGDSLIRILSKLPADMPSKMRDPVSQGIEQNKDRMSFDPYEA